MANDDRDLLTVLKEELEFLEKGGYQHSPRRAVEVAIHLRGLADVSQSRQNAKSPTLQRVRLDQSRSRRLPW